MACSNRNGVGTGGGFSRGATVRFNPELSNELEIYGSVFGWTQKRILEESVKLFFKANPLTKKERDSAEFLMSRRR